MERVCLAASWLLVITSIARLVQAVKQAEPEDAWPVRCSHNCQGINTCHQVCTGEQSQIGKCPSLPACPKPGEDKSVCPTGPEKCQWTIWSDWVVQTKIGGAIVCSGLCTRTRAVAMVNKCGGDPCEGALVGTKACPDKCENIRPSDCAFSVWSQWSLCGIPFPNQRNRSRKLMTPPTQGGHCPVNTLSQTEPCGDATKGANCTVSDWLEWNLCDKTCGENAQKNRFRSFTHRATGGFACQESMAETAPCWPSGAAPSCGAPMDCQYTAWTEWISGVGSVEKQRTRFITRAANGGKLCENAALEETQPSEIGLAQNQAVDCRLQDWSTWKVCDRTCGGGQQSRTRTILDLSKNGGRACPESSLEELRPCNTDSCDISHPELNCQLSAWAAWSQCTVTCGVGGQYQRKRSVMSLAKEGGEACSGALTELQACAGNPPCAMQDCEWGTWGDWSQPSATCGTMVLKRQRSIVQNATVGGGPCKASDEAAEVVVTRIKCPENCIDGKWAEWGEWSACTKTCNSGYRFKSRNVLVTANHCGKPVTGAASAYEKCNENMKCQGDVDCVLSEWGPWSSCSSSCGGVANRTRHVLFHGEHHGKYCGTTSTGQALSQIQACNSISTPPCNIAKNIACEFSPWAPWTSCSNTCMGGVMSRARTIVTQPSRTGPQCQDSLNQTRSCNQAMPCGAATDCQWDNWEEWGACTKCSGQSFRTRKIKQLALAGGKPCEAADAEQVKRCAKDCGHIAKYFCIWSSWGSWSVCTGGSDPCGNGTRVRTMSLAATVNLVDEYAALAHTEEDCSGSKMVRERCDAGPCTQCNPLDCIVGDWSDWGLPDCEGTCSRSRQITQQPNECGKPCTGSMNSSKSCPVQGSCSNRDCSLSSWSEWTTCQSAFGQKYHYRSIKHHARNEGQACESESLNDTAPCLSESDKVDCTMSAWGPWQACDKTCVGGQQKRTRSITQEASHGGEGCSEPLEMTMPCNQETKCIEANSRDCTLSDWTMWSGCNTSKELQSFRMRAMRLPALGSGKPCGGALEQTRSCVAPVPCEWSGWNDWSLCSSTCNEGHQVRSRGVASYSLRGGSLCEGGMIVIRQCNNNTKCRQPRDCVMSEWMPWSACSPACGRGQKERKRTVKISPAEGGKKCPENMHEVGICESVACAGDTDCKWADWAEWDACVPAAGNCGVGYQRRKRGFIAVPIGAGRLCPPRVKEEVVPVVGCGGQRQCCKDGRWGLWSEWSVCSVTCGGGLRRKTRTLEVKETWCGKPAPGSDSITESCNALECTKTDCQFSQWSLWEPGDACMGSCIEGHQTRTRSVILKAANGGLPCVGNAREWQACPVADTCTEILPVTRDCIVSEWGAWSVCSKTCDGGHMERSRNITRAPAYGGKACPSTLRVLASCNTEVACGAYAATNCYWDAWGEWQACGADGQQIATRNYRIAMHNGAPCVGPSSKVQACGLCTNATFSCGWGQWEEWGACSATCGTGGTRKRMRYLITANEPIMDRLFDGSMLSVATDELESKRADPAKEGSQSNSRFLALSGLSIISFAVAFGAWSRWRQRYQAASPHQYMIASQLLEEGTAEE